MQVNSRQSAQAPESANGAILTLCHFLVRRSRALEWLSAKKAPISDYGALRKLSSIFLDVFYNLTHLGHF